MCFEIRRQDQATVSVHAPFNSSVFVLISLHARILSCNIPVSSQENRFRFNCVTYMQRRTIRNNWLPWTNIMQRDSKVRHEHYKTREKERGKKKWLRCFSRCNYYYCYYRHLVTNQSNEEVSTFGFECFKYWFSKNVWLYLV